ncbi:hypothetical protein BDZ89DRAFT_1059953 [Hymenopellis radicata]|nr:hypothetical protein BDZ89DRAFT_1059953 [Hymenopellis radicata]
MTDFHDVERESFNFSSPFPPFPLCLSKTTALATISMFTVVVAPLSILVPLSICMVSLPDSAPLSRWWASDIPAPTSARIVLKYNCTITHLVALVKFVFNLSGSNVWHFIL